jgi:hypothetical protein
MSRLLLTVLCTLLLAGCHVVPELEEVAPTRVPRSQYSGWIETRHEILPQVFEYTVRMRDGSSRVFQETLPTSWRLGERLTVIDGATAIR